MDAISLPWCAAATAATAAAVNAAADVTAPRRRRRCRCSLPPPTLPPPPPPSRPTPRVADGGGRGRPQHGRTCPHGSRAVGVGGGRRAREPRATRVLGASRVGRQPPAAHAPAGRQIDEYGSRGGVGVARTRPTAEWGGPLSFQATHFVPRCHAATRPGRRKKKRMHGVSACAGATLRRQTRYKSPCPPH